MVARCVVAGCGNVVHHSAVWEEVVSLHLFPKDGSLRKAWAAFVKQRRSDWEPISASLICSKHFSDDSFDNKIHYLIMAAQGDSKVKLRLNKGAVPSINEVRKEDAGPSKRQRRSNTRLVRELLEAHRAQTEDTSDLESESDDESEFESMDELDPDDCLDDPTDPLWTAPAVEDVNYDEWDSIESKMKFGDIMESKLIVTSSRLLELLRVCRKCPGNGDNISIKIRTSGAVFKANLRCGMCGEIWKWQSLGRTAQEATTANSQLTGSILFTGSIPSKVFRYMETNAIKFPLRSLFFDNQKETHLKVVQKLWEEKKAEAIQESCTNGPVNVGGDARCDSMGFSSQFGSYTIMDLKSKKILDVQSISRVETKMNSVAMELERLKRSLSTVRGQGVRVNALVTDRHIGISAYMSKEEPSIQHCYDCWHVAKSVTSKLKEISKRAKCRDDMTSARISSIKNTLYRMAQTTEPGPQYAQVMDEKRLGILRHVIGQHRHPDNEFYKACHHRETHNLRMDPDRPAYDALRAVLSKPAMRKGIARLSPVGQTSRIEAYHHVVLMFAPKNLSFGYSGMVARLNLAAIHYNENCNREALLEKDGSTVKMRVNYSKWRGGVGSARIARGPSTFNYVMELMKSNLQCSINPLYRSELPDLRPAPPSMTSQLDREPRDAVVQRHQARFDIM